MEQDNLVKNDEVKDDVMNVEDVTNRPSEVKEKNNNSGKILALVLVLSLLVIGAIVAIVLLLPKTSNNPVIGKWTCYIYSWYSHEFSDEPVSELLLNADGSFMYGYSGDMADNHYAGDYTVSEENKDSSNGYDFYKVEFGPVKEYYLDGVAQDITGKQMGNIEMSVKNSEKGKEATVIFEQNYYTYNCLAE